MPTRRSFLMGTLAVLPAMPAIAQSFNARQVQIYVPFAAGGAVDIVARKLAEQLAIRWGRQPIIVNRPGAGGTIATQAMLQNPADGYSFIVVANGHPLNQFFYEKLPYDTFKDFTPVVHVGQSPLAIIVSKSNPTPGLREYLDAMRPDPKGLSYGLSGIGTSAHLAGALLAQTAKINLVPVPYRSGAQAVTGVLAGDIPMSINPLAEVVGQIEGGTVRVLAVTTAARAPSLPNVPTVAEAGYPGFNTAVWWGVVAPAGLPADVLAALNRDLNAALQEKTVRDSFATLGAAPTGSTPQAFEAFLHAEADKWGPIIKSLAIKL